MQQQMERRLEEVFGPEGGVLAKMLQRYFSDESSTAVQHQVLKLVDELMAKSREDMRKLFSAQDGHNPLADLKGAVLATVKQADERQALNLRGLDERMAKLQQEMQALRDEKQKLEELEAERERGTAKGRSFEELVAEALDSI